MLLRPGDTFAGCRILSLCGSGGMGVVYLAQDALGRTVALKIVPLCDFQRELTGIRRYIRTAAGQPNLIQIFHAGIERDCLFYIMEAADSLNESGPYVPKTLAALLARDGKIVPSRALKLIRELADGLQILHRDDLIHRDIKPENIIFVQDVPKLCDPGLVCTVDATASLVGTLGYLPPECFDGENLNDPGRDVYALGKVFYIAVSGESPARFPILPLDMPLSVRRKFWPVLTRVCDTNPKHRFASVREFCQALPEELPPAGRLERMLENGRQWILAHPFFLPSVSVGLILLVIAGFVAGGCYFQIQQRRAEQLRQWHQQCRQAEKRFFRRMPQLSDQLFDILGEKNARSLLTELKNPPSHPKERLACYRKLDSKLKELASRQLPVIPAKASGQDICRLSDQVRGLLASPLADWLDPKEKTQVFTKIQKLEKQVFSADISLKPGREFAKDSSFRNQYVYVPAGVFRNKKGKLIRVPYAFWCSDGELRADIFKQVMGQNDTGLLTGLPMTRMVWNDLLEYCRHLTVRGRERGQIPEGYIVRPLTTREWQWACRGAWSGPGKATAFLKHNSGGKARPVRSGEPNLLGIYDMLGNVAEITIPEPQDRQPHCVEYCGAYYSSKSADPEKHSPYLKYQFLPPFIGSRIAIVPGNMDFFEREFWVSEPRHTVFQGRHYELLATNESLVRPGKARNLCRLLGGHLLIPDSKELLKALDRAFIETRSFPVCIDGALKDGRWFRPDGKPYADIPMPGKPVSQRWLLSFHGGRIRVYNSNICAGLICQWDDAEYRNRNKRREFRNEPAVLHSFRQDKNLYLLVDYPAHSHTARRIAQLLGGRLAEPRTPALKERFQKELAPWKKVPVMLGGIRKFDQWVYPDGTIADLDLELRGPVILNSMNLASPGLLEGQFCAIQSGRALLVELPLE